jgi:hypothetical protein
MTDCRCPICAESQKFGLPETQGARLDVEPTSQESGTDLIETLRFRFFHLLLDNWPIPVFSDRQIQQVVAMTNRLIGAVQDPSAPSPDGGRRGVHVIGGDHG